MKKKPYRPEGVAQEIGSLYTNTMAKFMKEFVRMVKRDYGLDITIGASHDDHIFFDEKQIDEYDMKRIPVRK